MRACGVREISGAFVVGVVGLAAVGCGPGDEEAQPSTTPAAVAVQRDDAPVEEAAASSTSTVATTTVVDATTTVATTSVASESTTDGSDEVEYSLADLSRAFETTATLPRARFSLGFEQAVDRQVIEAMTTFGFFDDNTGEGVATRRLAFFDDAGEFNLIDVEYRRVGTTLWISDPAADPPRWGGFDASEFAELAGGDVAATMDPDPILQVVEDAIIEVVDIAPRSAWVGPRKPAEDRWWVTARADDLVPLIALGPTSVPLTEGAAAESGIEVPVEIHVDRGVVSWVEATMDEWAQNVAVRADPAAAALIDDLRFTLKISVDDLDWVTGLEDPFDWSAPCDSPTTEIVEGMTALVCLDE